MDIFRPTALALACIASLAALPALAQPNVAIVDIQPSLADVAQAFPLAAPSSLDDESYEISLNVTLRNDEPTRVELAGADLVFGPGFTPFTSSLYSRLMMKCGSDPMTAVTVSGRIDPGETCRLLLTNDTRLEPWVPQWITLNLFFTGYSPLVTLVPIVSYYNDQDRGGFLFPAKAKDLAPGEFWSARSKAEADGHRQTRHQLFAYDAGVGRWDADAGVWTPFHPLDPGEPANGDENEDWLVWGKPIYAMADGVVDVCTEGVPNNVPRVSGDSSGNAFGIMHGPDERAVYMHLIKGSLNPALCFSGAIVRAGDFLGLAGNSGSSSAPHFHVDIQRNGKGFPLLFRDAFIVDRNNNFDVPDGNADWEYVDGKGLPWEELAIWPSPLRRRDTQVSSTGSAVALTDLSPDTVAVGARNSDGNLDLRTWDRVENGDLDLDQKVIGEPIRKVAMARTSVTSQFATALQTESNQLKVVTWDGALSELDSAVGGQVRDVAVASSPHLPGVVTAVRTDGGALQVAGWEVDAWGGVSAGGSAAGGPISSVAIATAPTMGGVVTAVRTGGGELLLSSWQVTNDENFVGWAADYTDVAIWDPDIAYLGEVGGRDRFLTAGQNAAGNLYLVSWEVQGNGDIVRLDDYSAEEITDVAVSDSGDSHALTAVILAPGEFELIGWKIASDGTIERHGESVAEAVTDLALGNAMPVNFTSRRQAVSVVREVEGGGVRISSWEVALEP